MDTLRLIDADNNIYNFPNDFWISDDGWQVTQNLRNIAFAAGGKNIADKFLEARTFLIEGYLRASDKYTLETMHRLISKAILVGGQLYVIGDTVNRYAEVSSPKVNSNYSNDYRLEKQYNISFLVEYPFWQAANETEVINIITNTTGADSFTIDNSDSDHFVLPIIEIVANQGFDIPYARILNLSDGGMFFEYEDPTFVQGDTVIINSIDGTVTKNGNDSIVYFTTPQFLRLQDVVNNLVYDGNACTINIRFRRVTL